MAVMWPRKLPHDVKCNPLRSTECEVFQQLETSLDDSYVVFYSRPWLGLKSNGEEIDGECDFVVAHSELGILILEVKGGAVGYDPHKDQWTSRDRWGVTHKIKNPAQQAVGSKHVLIGKIRESAGFKNRYIKAQHGVVMPHSTTPDGDLGPNMPLSICCFCERFRDDFQGWILGRFGNTKLDREHHKGRTGWLGKDNLQVLRNKGLKGSTAEGFGQDGLEVLVNILAKPFQLRIPLGVVLSQDDAVLRTLTQQQFHILRAIEEVRRAAVSGGAGTGKTVLAVEEALRHAENGNRTLFLCYNRGLAQEIQRALKDNLLIEVMTFHVMCRELLKRAGLLEQVDMKTKEAYQEIMPRLAIQALECLADFRYDAIIVDEGQDFHPLWWKTLETALAPNGAGRFRVFYDNNQRIYSGASNLPKNIDLIPIRLSLNLRNTKRIHELVRQHYTGHEIDPIGPEGVEVKWIEASSFVEQEKKILEHVILLVKDGIKLGDIAVLVETEVTAKGIAPNGRFGKFCTARCDELAEDRIVIDSIKRFKGLDRSVVILAATPSAVRSKELSYVALSRARTCLIIVGGEEELNKLRTGS